MELSLKERDRTAVMQQVSEGVPGMQEATARLGVTRRRMRCLEREGAGAVVLRVAGPPVEPGSRASGARAGVGTGGGATLRGCRPARRASSVAAGDRPRGVVRRDGDAGRRTRLHGALEERLLADSRSAGSGGWRAAPGGGASCASGRAARSAASEAAEAGTEPPVAQADSRRGRASHRPAGAPPHLARRVQHARRPPVIPPLPER